MFIRSLSKALCFITVISISVACETATPYQAVGENAKYGFTDQLIEDDRAVVRFAGNSLTDQATVETYLLFRAAELAREKGFDYFNVVKSETDENRHYVPTGYSYAPYYANFYCNYRPYHLGGAYPRNRHYLTRSHRSGAYAAYHFHPRGNVFGFGLYDPFFDSPLEVVRYEAESEIIMGRGQKPNGAEYFDARQVMKNLSNKIVRPEIL